MLFCLQIFSDCTVKTGLGKRKSRFIQSLGTELVKLWAKKMGWPEASVSHNVRGKFPGITVGVMMRMRWGPRCGCTA